MALEQALHIQGTSSFSEKKNVATKNIKLAPKFQETEVDKYFCTLKKLLKVWNGLRNLGNCCYNQCLSEKLGKYINPYRLNNVLAMMYS